MAVEKDEQAGASSTHQTSINSQIFKTQRVASRRLAMQYLYALDARAFSIQLLEQELAKFPARIEEARKAQFEADHTPPPVDEEGNPLPVVRPTALLTDQLATQQEALTEYVEQEHQAILNISEEQQEDFFLLAADIWSESVPAMPTNALVFTDTVLHRILRKGWSRARKLVKYILAQKEDIDQLIAQAAQNWRLERMSCVDRNILRVATGELKFDPEVSAAIVINEAIEMAKAYGQKDSWRFVNGVLDRIRKDLQDAPLVIDGSSPETLPEN
ncbi:MAG: transcription antitermination factor NusB [Victivallales bacterium]|nr:transcription antitermination factor NusB [Victivallales bacterium]